MISRRPVGHESAAPGCHSNRLGCWRHSSAAGASLHGRRHQRSSGRTRRFGVSAHVWRASPDLIVGPIAGGETAFIKAVEGAEDKARSLARATCGSVDSGQGSLSLVSGGKRPYSLCGGRPCVRQGNWVQRPLQLPANQGSKIGESAALAIEPVPGPGGADRSNEAQGGNGSKASFST